MTRRKCRMLRDGAVLRNTHRSGALWADGRGPHNRVGAFRCGCRAMRSVKYVLLEAVKKAGRSLPRPSSRSQFNPRKLALCELVKFLVRQPDAQLHDTVCSHATSALMLALAHTTAIDSINWRFDEEGGDPPSRTLPCVKGISHSTLLLKYVTTLERL